VSPAGGVAQALRRVRARLAAAGIDNAEWEARRLMAASLGVEPGRITLHLHDEISGEAEAALEALVSAREARRPLSHVLGGRMFHGHWFIVTADVLDPRDDTETLVEAALAADFADVLDLGTGSGCILLSLLAQRPEARGVGVDLSQAALAVAARNAEALGVAARCRLLRSDWFDGVAGRFDLIVSNPPYIAVHEMADLDPELRHEPRIALSDEGDGLSAYRILASGAGAHLREGGRLMVEIGWKQGPAVVALLRAAGFADLVILPDLEGRDRVVSGLWQG